MIPEYERMYLDIAEFRAFVDLLTANVIRGDLSPEDLSGAVGLALEKVADYSLWHPTWEPKSITDREIDKKAEIERIMQQNHAQFIADMTKGQIDE